MRWAAKESELRVAKDAKTAKENMRRVTKAAKAARNSTINSNNKDAKTTPRRGIGGAW